MKVVSSGLIVAVAVSCQYGCLPEQGVDAGGPSDQMVSDGQLPADLGIPADQTVPDAADIDDPDSTPRSCTDGEIRPFDLEQCSGQQVCEGGRWLEPEFPPEVCDGTDNDCDQAVDEGFDVGDACSVGVGVCTAAGHRECDDLTSTRCSAEPGEPLDEACNGLDDDCDGRIDEAIPATGTACDTGRLGMCAMGQNACVDGSLVCANATDSTPESCDALDNDCDGSVDEGLGLGEICRIGVGACQREGQLECGGPDDTVCSVVAGEPAGEVCNGLDDDCDGAVDESDPASSQPCETNALGACRAGVTTCVEGQLECRSLAEPSAEVCDGVDNDCDGEVDLNGEGARLTSSCYEGPDGTQAVGACRMGTVECVDGGWSICNGQQLPALERCNDIDDDCNGVIDDAVGAACVCAPDEQRNCYTGPEGTLEVGHCSSGTQVCAADGHSWQECVGEHLPGIEQCNEIDDNCDGLTDNVDGLGEPCTVGDGACEREGTLVCRGEGSLVCEPVDPNIPVGCEDGTHCIGAARVDSPCNGCPEGTFVPTGFACLPGGEFWMGATNEALCPLINLSDILPPQQTVVSTFMIGITEVTRGQWARHFPDDRSDSGCDLPECPVAAVTWFDAAAYANAESRRIGLPECYQLNNCDGVPGVGWGLVDCDPVTEFVEGCRGFRLPTEAEWEYAARSGGTAQLWPWGNEPADCEHAVFAERVGNQFPSGCGRGGAWPVCAKQAGMSAQGVCDLSGNVAEWTQDAHSYEFADNPLGAAPWKYAFRGQYFGESGGCYVSAPYRLLFYPSDSSQAIGIRLVRSAE